MNAPIDIITFLVAFARNMFRLFDSWHTFWQESFLNKHSPISKGKKLIIKIFVYFCNYRQTKRSVTSVKDDKDIIAEGGHLTHVRNNSYAFDANVVNRGWQIETMLFQALYHRFGLKTLLWYDDPGASCHFN